MKIEVIDTHSVAMDLLTGGPVLDAGCLGMAFSSWFGLREHQVVALDPSPLAYPYPLYDEWAERFDGDENIDFRGLALVGGPDESFQLVMTDNPEACYLSSDKGEPVKTVKIDALGVDHWDVVKLDIEGSEYGVLEDIAAMPAPITRILTFELHEHTPRKRGDAYVKELFHRLSRNYKLIQTGYGDRHHAGNNWWDVLMVSRGGDI